MTVTYRFGRTTSRGRGAHPGRRVHPADRAGAEPGRDALALLALARLRACSPTLIERRKAWRRRAFPRSRTRGAGEARKHAETDALTGLYNQRYFHETLRREVMRAQRYERSLALIVFDLDDFKGINDKVGHLAGDRVLAQAADRLREAVRSVDVAAGSAGTSSP